MRENALRRANLKRVRRDRMRPLRVLEYLDHSAVFENSPVEIKEGYLISDRDNGELFLTLNLRSLSKKTISALHIRILLYRDQMVVPYLKLEYTYSWEQATFGERVLNGVARKERECRNDKTLVYGEEFGEGIYIPLPDSWFKKMQIELVSVTYFDGSAEKLELLAGSRALRYLELDDDLHDIYREVNIFHEAEQAHPIRVMPQAGQHVWLCCCGRKNPAENAICEKCGRDKDWQLENLTVTKFEETRREQSKDRNQRVLHDTSAYKQNKYMESKEELERKVEMCNQALERIAIQEKARERRQMMLLPKVLLWFGIVGVVIFLVNLFLSFLSVYGYTGTESAFSFLMLQ